MGARGLPVLGVRALGGELPAYYVNGATGNDTTGNGSFALPWATITKAIATVPDIACNVMVAAGTYAENTAGTKFLFITRVFTHWVTIRPWNTGDTVLITDAASGTFCVDFWGCQKIRFRDITIEQAGANSVGTVCLGNGAGFELVNCTITTRNRCVQNVTGNGTFTLTGCTLVKRTGEVGAIKGVSLSAASGETLNAILNNCTVTGQAATGTGVAITLTHVNGSVSMTINGGTYTTSGAYVASAHGGNLAIVDGTFVATTTPAVVLGTDGAATYTTTGSVSGATITSASSHALLIGQGSSGVQAINCAVNTGDYGIVVKGADAVVDGCDVTAGTLAGMLLKGCDTPVVRNNTLRANQAGQACLTFSLQDAIKVSDVTFTDNILIATGAADGMVWPNDTIDAGGGVCDRNTYNVSGTTGNVGDVRATANITTLAALQGAWSGYDNEDNDANSTVTS